MLIALILLLEYARSWQKNKNTKKRQNAKEDCFLRMKNMIAIKDIENDIILISIKRAIIQPLKKIMIQIRFFTL